MSHRRERARPVPLESSDRLWSTQEVSDFLGVPVTTLH
jgi:hypothetical protein